MPQAVFFDLDETLIRHTTPVMDQLQTVCHQHLADLSEQRWATFNQHLMTNAGQLWRDILAHQGRCEAEFIAIFRSSLELVGGNPGLAESMIEAFLASVVDSTGLTEDALQVLDRLAAAGIATGIITNGFSFLQKRKVLMHGLAERVRFVLTSEDAGAHKPDPRIFRMALDQVGVAAADAWHVGDHRDNDLAGALNAGLDGVLYDPEGKHAGATPGELPYRVITRLSDVPELLAIGGR